MASPPVEYCKKDMLAILGTAPTLPQAPFTNDLFEIWATASVQTYPEAKRYEYLFELHGKGYWSRPEVVKRLNSEDVPIYMINANPEIPNSIRYPIEDILKYGRYQTTSISYMLALAFHSFVLTQKPHTVGIWGVHMEAGEEFEYQRPCCEYWIGKLEGAGVSVDIAPGGALLAAPNLYGYEQYNPICYDIKNRIQQLSQGADQFETKRNNMEFNRAKQLGAVAENQYWLGRFQHGNIPTNGDEEWQEIPASTGPDINKYHTT